MDNFFLISDRVVVVVVWRLNIFNLVNDGERERERERE